MIESKFFIGFQLRMGKRETIIPWSNRNIGIIYSLMEKSRKEYYLADLNNNNGSLFDPKYYALSEMPLDRSLIPVYQTLKEKGYKIVRGRLAVIDGQDPLGLEPGWISHTYASNPKSGEIVDFTFAQGFSPQTHLAPRRIEKIYRAAPELVTRLPYGIALLSGKVTDIAEKTGLQYTS